MHGEEVHRWSMMVELGQCRVLAPLSAAAPGVLDQAVSAAASYRLCQIRRSLTPTYPTTSTACLWFPPVPLSVRHRSTCLQRTDLTVRAWSDTTPKKSTSYHPGTERSRMPVLHHGLGEYPARYYLYWWTH